MSPFSTEHSLASESGFTVREEMKTSSCTIAIFCFCVFGPCFLRDGPSIEAREKKPSGTWVSKRLTKLARVPFGEKTGLVLHTVRIPIETPYVNYNPSIVPFQDGYLLSFRHDIPDPNTTTRVQRRSVVGLVRLDATFHVVGSPKYLDLGYRHCEDARLFYVGDKLFICCCVFFPSQMVSKMGVGQIDLQSLEPQEITLLDYPKSREIEKNWTPLVYSPVSGQNDLYFVYSFMPSVVLKALQEGSGTGVILNETTPIGTDPVGKVAGMWTKKWGDIRGGTPAVKVGEQYVTFFHSQFQVRHQFCYLMGVATLGSTPPFRMTRISRRPILFKKMFSAPRYPKFPFALAPHVHVVFPGGFVEGRYQDREVFHVVYGDNDSAIGVVTIDKEMLLKTLKKVR